MNRKKYTYCAFFLLMITVILPTICVDEPPKNWSNDVWQGLSHPIIAGIVVMMAKPIIDGVVYSGKELYVSYCLTEEQQKELQEKASEAEKERRINRLAKEHDLALQSDPEWIRLTIEHKKQQVASEGYKLIANAQIEQTNELALLEERIAQEKKDMEHLDAMIVQALPENRAGLLVLKDEYIKSCFEKRMRK